MKISIGTILIVGGLVYLLTRPQTLPEGDIQIDPGPGPGPRPNPDPGPVIVDDGTTTNSNIVDVYSADGTYHHTEVTNADGTVDIYDTDPVTGELIYYMPKPGQGKPKTQTTTTVSGIRGMKGIGRKRCNGDTDGYGSGRLCADFTNNVSGNRNTVNRKRTASPSFLI